MKRKVQKLRNAYKYIGIIILCGVCVIGCKHSLDTSPRKPNYSIPVTYNQGWWAYQEDLQIDSFRVEIIDSRLNLFNSQSLISYTVKGNIFHKKDWEPHIEKVHISETLNKDTISVTEYDRIIEITPVVEVTLDKKLMTGVKAFSIKNEHLITSNKWGNNRIKLICGDKEQIIELIQRK